MLAEAPAVIKLLGEYGSLYGKTALAAAIGIKAKAEINDNDEGNLVIELGDLGSKAQFDQETLSELYKSYRQLDINRYVSTVSPELVPVLPFSTIAARVARECKVELMGKRIKISSDIPRQRGCASSGACAVAFTKGILKACNLTLTDEQLIDIARDGERVAHRSRVAGGIDISTSFYKGYVTFGKDGAKKEDVETDPEMLLIDTGPKKSTYENIEHVADLYKNDKKGTDAILDGIEVCMKIGLKALKSGNIEEFGKALYDDQGLLERLGVSSPKLDKAIAIAMANGAYGAKLSGGGGGGIAIAVADDYSKPAVALEAAGFETRIVKVFR